MKLLATSGNAGHGTARQATTVQRAKRVLGIAKTQPTLDTAEAWKKVERLAAIGMPQEFKGQLASYMVGFRRTHPHDDGGDDARTRCVSRAALALGTRRHTWGLMGVYARGAG